MNALLMDNLQGIRQIKAYGQQAHEDARFAQRADELRKGTLGVMRVWAAYSPAMSFTAALGSGLVLWVGGRLVVCHTFRSKERQPLEVVYAFGLPRDAALRRFLVRGEGFRARSAFKIDEIARRFSLLKKGARVLDLGAAPGGFLQVLSDMVGPPRRPGECPPA